MANNKHQQTAHDLECIIIHQLDSGSYIIYGLPEVVVLASVGEALDMVFELEYSHHDILITKKARAKDG